MFTFVRGLVSKLTLRDSMGLTSMTKRPQRRLVGSS